MRKSGLGRRGSEGRRFGERNTLLHRRLSSPSPEERRRETVGGWRTKMERKGEGFRRLPLLNEEGRVCYKIKC